MPASAFFVFFSAHRRCAVGLAAVCALAAWPRASASSPPLLRDVVQVSAGGAHTCAVTSSGGVKCWGNNGGGQLGDGTRTDRSLPVDVVGLTHGVAEVAAGSEHTCARFADGRVRCWGLNFDGQLGNGSGAFGLVSTTPVDVIGLTAAAIAISAGTEHTCALIAGGGAMCWGRNNRGQLGDGSTTDRFNAVAVTGMASGAASIVAAGSETQGFTCALTGGGAVRCWGANASGQLGDGGTAGRPNPQDVSGFSSGALGVAAGGLHACALTAAAGVKCWGSNSWGHLGSFGFGDPNSPTPRDVTNLGSGATAISARDELSCALMSTARVQCWGVTRFPVGAVMPVFTLTPVDQGMSGAVSLSVGGAPWSLESHVCIVTAQGGVQCKGGNAYGQLGIRAESAYTDTHADVLAGVGVYRDGFES